MRSDHHQHTRNPKMPSIIQHLYGTREVQDWILEDGSREQIIGWLVWNDGNGVYTDEDSIAEGWEPMTLDTAWQAMRKVLANADTY